MTHITEPFNNVSGKGQMFGQIRSIYQKKNETIRHCRLIRVDLLNNI